MTERKRTYWQWLEDFPTTNGQLFFGIVLVGFVVGVPLWLMAVGLKDRINETVIGILLGGALGLSGVSTYQKVKKWDAMPESAQEEPGGAEETALNVQPPAVAPRPDLGVPDRGVL